MTQGTALLATGERNSNGVSTAAAGLGQLVDDLARLWERSGYQVVLAGLVAVAVLLAIALLVSWRRGRVDRWVSTVTGLAVLALSAEGMWEVAREKLGLPVVVAAAVFFVGEAALVQSATQAAMHYRRTTVRGPDGTVFKPGTPGKHGRAVWTIAVVIGVIVALNAGSVVEFVLRLALPVGAAYLWWNSLTADGTGEGERSSWRWTPRRVLLWLGAIEPGDRDMETINRDRVTASMTISADQYHSGGKLVKWWYGARLRRLARTADDDLVDEVARRVERVQHITTLTDPATRAAQREELKALRAELEQQRADAAEVSRRREEQFRAELERAAREAAQRGHDGDERTRAYGEQLERVRRELNVVARERDEAREEMRRLSGVVDQLRASGNGRPAAGAGRGAYAGEGKAIVSEPVTPARPQTRQPTPEPVGSAGTATALAVREDEDGHGSSSDASARSRVFAFLDELAPDAEVEPRRVTETILKQVPECAEDTAARYYRKWRREVSEGNRQPGGRRLRVVPQRG